MGLKVNWITPEEYSDYNRMPASVWLRCYQLIPYLERLGVKSTLNSTNTDSDIAVFVRFQNEEAFQMAKKFRSSGTSVVFDLVVNYFDQCKVPLLGEPVNSEQVDECLKMASVADLITCASDNIAQRARQHHHWVEYLPDSIDPAHFNQVKDLDDFQRKKIRAIWSGQFTKSRELEPILPLLKDRGMDLTVISNGRPELRIPGMFWRRKFHFNLLHWRYETFPRDILNGEVHINYRETDTAYNRGHSFFKIGVFMAQGVPAVASGVPSYRELLDDGSCGKVCGTLDQWAQTLDEILAHRNLLIEWSSHSRRRMEEYATDRIAEKYRELFTRLAER